MSSQMRQGILAGLMLVMVVAPGPSWAQEEVAWPPDPAEIFAAGVEVVETELVEEIDTSPVVDNEARVIRVYDGEWREFPFPNDVHQIFRATMRSDGTLLVNLEEHEFEPSDYLILDPTTGIYIQSETVCGNQIRALSGEGHWYYRINPDTSQVHLCFTETGELSEALPDNVNWFVTTTFDDSPNPSPDGRWLALLGYREEDSFRGAVVYSYETATGILNFLGSIPASGELTYIEAWISDTQGTVLNGYPQESLSDDFYGFDVTKPNSLEFSFNGWYSFRENPPRFEYLETDYFRGNKTGTNSSRHSPCVLYLYDAEGIDWYELGYDCVSLTRVDDGYFFVRFDSNPATYSTLVHLNRTTGEFTELFRGEIEKITSISPDGRYAGLWLGKDGEIISVDQGEFEHTILFPGDDERAVIFDVTTQEIVFEAETFMGIVAWMKPDVALAAHISVEANEYMMQPESYSLMSFREGITQISVDGGDFIYFSSFLLSPDGQRSAAYTSYQGLVINLETGEVTTLIYLPTSLHYSMEFTWEDVDLLSVVIRPIADYLPDPTHSATYTLRIP